jgi:glycosyltransferase involved in cell wall biosynthesis
VRAAAVRISRGFSNSADHVVVPTQGVADLLRSYGVHRPITVIPTGIDLDLIDSRPGRPRRAESNIRRDVPLIAFSGRIALEKNLALLVRALGRLARAGSEAHAVLIGGGPWQDKCLQLAEAEGIRERVHMTGYLERQDLFDWLAEADLFCFPSLTDTQGVAVLEAMALGCPPVAARSGAVTDVIRDGLDGLLVDPEVEPLSLALDRMLSDTELRRSLAGHARARAEEFSAGRMALKLVTVYEQVMGS